MLTKAATHKSATPSPRAGSSYAVRRFTRWRPRRCAELGAGEQRNPGGSRQYRLHPAKADAQRLADEQVRVAAGTNDLADLGL